MPISQAPEWLAVLLRATTNERPATACVSKAHEPSDADALLAHPICQATPGNRNLTGFTLACTLRNQGVPEREAEVIPVCMRSSHHWVSIPIPSLRQSTVPDKHISVVDHERGSMQRASA